MSSLLLTFSHNGKFPLFTLLHDGYLRAFSRQTCAFGSLGFPSSLSRRRRRCRHRCLKSLTSELTQRERIYVHFANYRFSFRKLQILISQTTDFHFANYRFPFVPFRFVSFRFVPFRFANYSKPRRGKLASRYLAIFEKVRFN